MDGVIWCIPDNVDNFCAVKEINENDNWLIGLYVAITVRLVLLNTAKCGTACYNITICFVVAIIIPWVSHRFGFVVKFQK